MSYPAPNTGNTMNDLFSRLSDFAQLSPKLLRQDTIEGFNIWLDKLNRIDRRSPILLLKEHKSQLPAEYIELARKICKADI